MIQGVSSQQRGFSCGVLQGWVCDPTLFNIDTLPAGDIAQKHGVDHLFFADDKNLWITLKQTDVEITLIKMESLISDGWEWTGYGVMINAKEDWSNCDQWTSQQTT